MLSLKVLDGVFAICRQAPEEAVPAWAVGCFTSVTRTDEELSIVCPAEEVPAGVKSERGWRCLKVAGPLDFSLTGVLSSLAAPLAEAGVSIFAVSTFDTDYLLVPESRLKEAIAALKKAGHRLVDSG
jgi:hypothetical protein